ncbi:MULTISPECIES: hypothetical protein [Moraxella]|uniref:Uncharacterized protein n=2 Tax=Moraxella TaxID=475 RepID=A0AAQ2T2Q0_MORBO|nr:MULTISPECIES: hypothetical protein [Moraxella]UYZ75864.1 hypothetical protein LP093_00535 [Moraxella bovis]UYZ78195.1 hypothetical protein LP115_13320 [Moraxella bovis]UYZ81081.1 hypothetical protein LP113_13950 [Moraxella bovis]UYZ86678.1 hypothetical protein LP094_13355 [Moraxella bovis]UYZ92103.1 hypothetical protein LP103_13370 [Moraxella bovis]
MNFDIIPPITGKDCFAKMGAIRDINRLKRTYGEPIGKMQGLLPCQNKQRSL